MDITKEEWSALLVILNQTIGYLQATIDKRSFIHHSEIPQILHMMKRGAAIIDSIGERNGIEPDRRF